jgi:hypothetical protein
MILLLALWLGCLLNSHSRRCVVMTYVDGWHGAVEWHMYETKRALESERPTGQLARLFRTRHA